MQEEKFYKRSDKIQEIEDKIAKYLIEIQQLNVDQKKNLQNLMLDSVKEIQIFDKKHQIQKKVILITIPYVCHKILKRIINFLTIEIEKRSKTQVFFIVKRKIDSKWIKINKSQIRPRSHCLNVVFDCILDDLCGNSCIIGKRQRIRQDGSKFYKIYLDEKDRDFMQNKIENISQIYKLISKRDVIFEFKPDHVFHQK